MAGMYPGHAVQAAQSGGRPRKVLDMNGQNIKIRLKAFDHRVRDR